MVIGGNDLSLFFQSLMIGTLSFWDCHLPELVDLMKIVPANMNNNHLLHRGPRKQTQTALLFQKH